jgi:hypothetical protein
VTVAKRNLSGVQLQALVWAAFKDGERPPRRALDQMTELGLIVAPVPGHDPHYRPTAACFTELRSRGLDRPRHGKKTALPASLAPREEVTAA